MEDSQPCINSLKANAITNRVKHIAVPIAFTHQQIAMEKLTSRRLVLISTWLTQEQNQIIHQHTQAIGVCFYPPVN